MKTSDTKQSEVNLSILNMREEVVTKIRSLRVVEWESSPEIRVEGPIKNTFITS